MPLRFENVSKQGGKPWEATTTAAYRNAVIDLMYQLNHIDLHLQLYSSTEIVYLHCTSQKP